MCQECYRWDDDYVDPEWTYQEALGEIEDLHTGDWTSTRLVDGSALCKTCDEWWPCVTFLTAVWALNDAH